MDIRQLHQFIAVAELLNFRRAAEKLRMAQPPLSQSIKRLEEAIKVRLLDRTNRSVRLTPAGVAFLDEARPAVSQIDHAVRVAQDLGTHPATTIRVGFGTSSTYRLITETVRAFRARYPNISLELRESHSLQMVELIASDQIDIGILRPVADLSKKFHVESVFKDRLALCAPAAHPLARRTRVEVSDLADEPFIVFATSRNPTTLHEKTLMACRDAGFIPKAVHVGGVHMETMVSLVASGLGVALLPAAVSTVKQPDVVFKRLADRSRHLDIELIAARRKGKPTPPIQAFLDIAREVGAGLYRQLHGRARRD